MFGLDLLVHASSSVDCVCRYRYNGRQPPRNRHGCCAADVPYLRRDHTGSSGPASRLLRSYRLADRSNVLDAADGFEDLDDLLQVFRVVYLDRDFDQTFPPSVEDLDSRMFVLRFEIAEVISARIPAGLP